MTSQPEPEIVLYDLACIKGVCFSPVVWRIRLMLNYKRIPYKTIFLEFPDIEPTLKALGLGPGESSTGPKYTVPTIQHLPTNTYLMGSEPIARFLESTYPSTQVPLTSDLGLAIKTQALTAVGKTFRASMVPREIKILSPRAQEYFRRTREAALGHRLEDLLDVNKEDDAWDAADEGMRAASELIQTHKADGPFILGALPSLDDFFMAGNLQSARMVDEGLFQRHMKYDGFKIIYEACLPYMEKRS
ncbi:putative GST N-terminal domain-containing protein [Seiridium cardinale]|uniref:GST N-terminal domain-containing protein n=1 Tax=Seiridium cardinale TaxID=138064 RepID=A0ABR2YA16_9PEZI